MCLGRRRGGVALVMVSWFVGFSGLSGLIGWALGKPAIRLVAVLS